ncbi:tryptophan synthase subunit alpha [Paenalcaligenes niemegkensis]|uniref:tryptophan synthase subunit alpha n=1 Tax=Paenalcaligenes niemegkensis TaxID=2895469 RepID=UPI001EE7A07E|nr:tryptophan synthase subunit alpha [Paenalcaligenes niemegkensis]MCQ9616901.1 tryptophan synthase subunit alpha [Paenalcaligenes niemegkensis]
MSQPSNARLSATFAQLNGRTALIPYIAAGDPSLTITPALMHALVEAGSDVIELGVPFSDPMADGPVIQRAAERAVKRGVSLSVVLDMVRKFRETDDKTPVVLMGYANPIEAMGQEVFARAAGEAGVDGVLTVDYPPEESVEFAKLLADAGIDPIFLLAPTSTEARMKLIAEVARGYVYYVSLKGVTGSGTLNTDEVAKQLEIIRRYVTIPVGVGFGIRDAESARRLSACADAVVIGSKLIETMEQAYADEGTDQAAIAAASTWLHEIHRALN